MDGRSRKGADARGLISDVEHDAFSEDTLVEKPLKKPTSISRKGLAAGLIVVVIGIVIWVWPSVNLVLKFIGLLSAGPKIVAYGIVLIVITILGDALFKTINRLLG